jgi:hypothetical protein
MSKGTDSIPNWVLTKLDAVKDSHRVLVQDPLHLLPEADGGIHNFARDHGYTVIVAATNLVFRELYERAIADPETKKILVIDRVPMRRRTKPSAMKAPPLFYPDLLAQTPKNARIDLDLHQFLKEITGDPNWPLDANDPRYARLIVRHLDGVLRAYRNLRTAHAGRFTDHDFKTIIAFAALGVAEAAFKKLGSEDYWRIGLLGHETLEELESLAPEVTRPIKDELLKARPPFRWFAERDAGIVIRAFYLSVILAQHFENWSLLLANIDPALKPLSRIPADILWESAPKLIALDLAQADRDLESVERSLNRDALQFLLLDQLKIATPAGFTAVVEKERYSTLLRSLALLLALDNLLSTQPTLDQHNRIADTLFSRAGAKPSNFVDSRTSVTWLQLKEAYRLASDIRLICDELSHFVKRLRVMKTDQLSFDFFREAWNGKKINRLEYYLSALERLAFSGDLLPRADDELPSDISNALHRIRQRVRALADDISRQLDEINGRFQELVFAQYPSWTTNDTGARPDAPCLTSQFLRRCLKPHWDPQREKAVVLIFDGMRYDIWDELLRPMISDRMEIIADLPASSLLPSETHISRKAISAGTYPDQFDTRSSEDRLLQEGLARAFNHKGTVEILTPDSSGTGETIRYRAGNLDVYIFEFCDKELHKIQMKTLPDGRGVPSRPLAFIYQRHLKDLIDNEVMAIVRSLSSGTKVFVTADHGFGRVHRERIRLDAAWLNEPEDCAYLNAWLRQSLDEAKAPGKVRNNVWEFPVSALRMPATEGAFDRRTKQTWQKSYSSLIFPKTGYALARPSAHFNPDAYSHGGISIQELMIPMIVLRVKTREEGLLMLEAISGPKEVVEEEEIEFRMRISRAPKSGTEELRVEVEAAYSLEPDRFPLPHQVLYVPAQGIDVSFRFRPDPEDATVEERRKGIMERTLAITVSCRDGQRVVRKSQTQRFVVRLNTEQIIRRVGSLGKILGLTPKSMRG